ncbi:MAG: aspartate aminotransferase family protein [Pseudomonadota bacterium]
MISPVMPTYARAPLSFERGEGSWLIANDGSRYLDFGAGIAVNALGHAHPKLVAALEAQGRRVWHVSNLYEIPEQRRLAEQLCAATFADTCFFTNSGTESNELLIKLARKYWAAQGQSERYRIVTFEGAFHGRSTGAIAAAGSAKMTDGFGPLMPGFDTVAWGDHEALKAAIGPETAAVLIEPIQGEGGIRPLPLDCLKGLRTLCDEHGVLLLLDEVQCGMGRTGYLFAHEAARIAPDAMAVAKGIGGGFPLGAVLATEAAAAPMVAGTHGSTYGGNPLACAIGSAVVETVAEPSFLAEVRRKAGLLAQRLGALADDNDLIEEVRGVGLMIGLRLSTRVTPSDLVGAARDERLIVVPAADNVVRLLPPLTVSDEEIGEGIDRLDRACKALQ